MNSTCDILTRAPSVVEVLDHELRTPLTVVMGHVELLAELGLDGQAARSIAAISAAADRLAGAVEGLSRTAESPRRPPAADSPATLRPWGSASSGC